MAKKRRIHSQHAVGAALTPEAMAGYINDYFGEQGQRIDARTKLQGALAADPAERAAIARTYQQSVQGRAGSLASRGLSAQGFSAADLTDIERDRVLAEDEHASKIRAAKAEYTSVIANLNNSRAAADSNAAAIAGQTIQAGTGRFKREKPRGWTPPALARTPDVDPNTGQPMPPAAAKPVPPKAPPTLAPTGARLPTGPAAARRLPTRFPKLAVGYAKRQVRLA